jgi:diaminopimelate epimerase
MCGNGARCVCRFAYELGIAGDTMTIETDAGIVFGQRISETVYRVQLNLPSVIDLKRTDVAAYIELGNPGIPHCVAEISGLDWSEKEQLRALARKLRFDPAFPKGVNVNFYDLLDNHTVRILTYERGVEDYTLACGTGSASTAVKLWAEGLMTDGMLTVKNPGGDLTITLQSEHGELTAIFLDGPTELIKTYEI